MKHLISFDTTEIQAKLRFRGSRHITKWVGIHQVLDMISVQSKKANVPGVDQEVKQALKNKL